MGHRSSSPPPSRLRTDRGFPETSHGTHRTRQTLYIYRRILEEADRFRTRNALFLRSTRGRCRFSVSTLLDVSHKFRGDLIFSVFAYDFLGFCFFFSVPGFPYFASLLRKCILNKWRSLSLQEIVIYVPLVFCSS